MEAIQGILAWVMSHWDMVWTVVTSVVAVAAAVAATTPSPTDDGIVAKIRQVIDWLALNVGHAKNAEPPKDGGGSSP